MMRCVFILMIAVIAVCGALSVVDHARAIAPLSPVQSGYEVWDDDDTQWQMLHIGTNTAGNNVVLVAYNTATDSVLKTYEITHSGTIVGLIDTGTYNDKGLGGGGNPVNMIHLMDNNWLIIMCGGANPVYRSVHITSEGGLSDLGDTIDGGSDIVTDSAQVSGTDILVLDIVAGAVRYIGIDPGDGELSLNATFAFAAPDPAGARDLCYLDDWSSGPIRAFAVFDSRPPETYQCLAVGTFNYSNKTLCNMWAGTGAANYIGDIQKNSATNVGQTISTGSVGAGDYVTCWRVGTPTGHGGDADIGIEWWNLTNISSIQSVGTVMLADTPGSNDAGECAYIISDNNLLFGYEAGGDKLRAVYNITDPPLASSQLSDEFSLPGGWKQGLVLQNDLLYLAIYQTGGNTYLATYTIQVPPTVSTDRLFEHGHNEGDAPPILSADGSVLACGDSVVTEFGFVYNQIGHPTYSGSKVVFSGTYNGPFSFSGTITEDLRFDDLYYVRAYAANNSGTGYGNQLTTFTHPLYSNLILDLDFEPLHVSAGTIMDQSGYAHDFSYTLAPNPAGIEYVIEDIQPTNLAEYTCTGSECEAFFEPQFVAPPGYILDPASRNFENLPGMEAVNEMLPENSIPARLFWLSGLVIVMIVAGLGGYRITGVLLVTAVIGLLILLFACSKSWMGWWVFAMCCVLTPGLLLKDESRKAF